MRVERTLVGLLCILAASAGGCGGKLAYNLPPSSRLMEPGPGVGGPGPGVIPPAGLPYGMYGGAVHRYGNGMGDPMGAPGGYGPGAPCEGELGGQPRSGVMQASYECEGEAGYPCDGCHGGGSCHQPYAFGRPDSCEAYAGAGAMMGMMGLATSQIAFLGDEGVQVSWDVNGYGMFDSVPLVIPGRQDFYQGAIYRLRLTAIPGRPAMELYPTLEVAPVTPRTDAYLAHSPIPVQFTEEDFDQVSSGNFVTKVIYLPDPEFQELALAGVETLVSTRLDPGVDPIAEADERGSILAILRMGNKDLRRGAPAEFQPAEEVVPASHKAAGGAGDRSAYAKQAVYNEKLDGLGNPAAEGGVVPAQYCGPYGDGAMGGVPMGMPTSGFAPPVVPPNYLAGAPQWGMPMTGTPIGLPGPPHVPLGVPAGLQKHVMKNRTRVLLPPPVSKVKLSVKQRPGLNYPSPVNHVHVNETQREPLRMPAWMARMFGGGADGGAAGGAGGYPAGDCPPY